MSRPRNLVDDLECVSSISKTCAKPPQILRSLIPHTERDAVMSSLDDAKSIALEYAKKQNPRVRTMRVSSAEQSLGGDKWIVEISWPVNDETISGTQYAKITVKESGSRWLQAPIAWYGRRLNASLLLTIGCH